MIADKDKSLNARLRHSVTSISNQQAIDTGMAFTLIGLLISLFTNHSRLAMLVALAFLLVTMIAPILLKPFAVLWFGFSHYLGSIMSAIILSLIFFVVIVPMGWLSQKLGKDSLKKDEFSRGELPNISAFNHRPHTYEKNDLQHPY